MKAFLDKYQKRLKDFEEEFKKYSYLHPEQAGRLNLHDDVAPKDPYVERLIEAFIFLTGIIDDRLDNAYLEFAQLLVEAIWPHYLYILPAAVIMELKPDLNKLSSIKKIDKGLVLSNMAEKKDIACKFSTCGPVYVRPIELTHVEKSVLKNGNNVLHFNFRKPSHVKWSKIGYEPMTIYLHGNSRTSLTWYQLLSKNLKSIKVSWNTLVNGEEQKSFDIKSLPIECFQPSIQKETSDYPLLPYPASSFDGYRLIEEYFHFPQKFRFFELDLFSKIDFSESTTSFQVSFELDQSDITIKPALSNFKLHCIHAINLFKAQADPIHLDYHQPYDKISVDRANEENYIPHHILKVMSNRIEIDKKNKEKRIEYKPFFSYRHESDQMKNEYYHIKHQKGFDQRPELFISIVNSRKSEETLSIDLMCCNDSELKKIRRGDINIPDQHGLEFIDFSNLTIPKSNSYQDNKKIDIWTLIEGLSLNYDSLSSTGNIKKLLSLHNRSQSELNKSQINGILNISSRPIRKYNKGGIINGVLLDVTLNENCYINEGDMILFSSILSKMMSMHSQINSICQLKVKGEKSNKEIYSCQSNGIKKTI